MTERRVLLVVSARSVVIADVRGLDIAHWQMHRVEWDQRPDDGETDRRVIGLVTDLRVEAIVVDEIAPRLRESLAIAGVAVFQRAGISARAAAVSAATVLALVQHTLWRGTVARADFESHGRCVTAG